MFALQTFSCGGDVEVGEESVATGRIVRMTGPDGFLRLWDLCDIKHGGVGRSLARDGGLLDCWIGRHLGNLAPKDLVLKKARGGKG